LQLAASTTTIAVIAVTTTWVFRIGGILAATYRSHGGGLRDGGHLTTGKMSCS
jgi:hypothetical protein